MQENKNITEIKEIINKLNIQVKAYSQKNPIFTNCINALSKAGAKLYLVGGIVRDICLQVIKQDLNLDLTKEQDVDIEVHKLDIEHVKIILSEFGYVKLVGKQFGVLKLEHLDIDWSLPRTDSIGRKPVVNIDPNLNIVSALKRRDLTINAMAYDIISEEFIDPFGGIKDIKENILRTPDAEFFIQDPLRFFRVMQFIGRFKFYPDNKLNDICKTMVIKDLSKERIEHEFEKLLLLSSRPSLGIRWLNDISRLKEILPELANTIGVPQDPIWHPEGDVFEHSMQTLDAAARYILHNIDRRLELLFASLCHDLGKYSTTEFFKGHWHSYNHAQAGAPLAASMLSRISTKKQMIKNICLLIKHHMDPFLFVENKAKAPAYKKLAIKLYPEENIKRLSLLAQSDRLGRNGKSHKPLKPPVKVVENFVSKAKEFGILEGPIKPLLMGKDLIELNLFHPGQELGKVLKKAYEIQIKDNINDKEKLIKKIVKGKKD